MKIKIGAAPLDHDLRRIETTAAHLAGSEHLAVDAMNTGNPVRRGVGGHLGDQGLPSIGGTTRGLFNLPASLTVMLE